ncbi:MAG: hypothetical protein RL272_415 [Candidatus Parcubacteria bacterium]|jgi:hypothetical protein
MMRFTRKDALLLIPSFFLACLLAPAFLWVFGQYYAYTLYMGWLASGVRGGYWRLPAPLAAELAPHYADDLSSASYAFTANLPADLAVADCTTVYFGDSAIVAHLRAGSPLAPKETRWLAHELTHGEQCGRWGGRREFAKTWFAQAGEQARRVIGRGRAAAAIGEYLRTENVAELHDAMPMEKEGDERARIVSDAFSRMPSSGMQP